jgi:hypothetical protein
MSAGPANRDVARAALEQVCAWGDMALAPSCYAEDFVDHFASAEYHGLEGVRRSTALYRALFDDLPFEVVDQVGEDDRVASRSVLTGSNRGRPVRLRGSRSAACRTGGSSRTTQRSTASSSSSNSASVGPSCPRDSCSEHCATLVAPEAQPGFVAVIVDPIAPNLAALRRVSWNVERA